MLDNMSKIHILGWGKINCFEFGKEVIVEDRDSLNNSEYFWLSKRKLNKFQINNHWLSSWHYSKSRSCRGRKKFTRNNSRKFLLKANRTIWNQIKRKAILKPSKNIRKISVCIKYFCHFKDTLFHVWMQLRDRKNNFRRVFTKTKWFLGILNFKKENKIWDILTPIMIYMICK